MRNNAIGRNNPYPIIRCIGDIYISGLVCRNRKNTFKLCIYSQPAIAGITIGAIAGKIMNDTNVLMQIRDLSVTYKTRLGMVSAVDHVSSDIQKGEILGVVGESG